MRDLNIDEEFDIPVDIDKEQMIEEIILDARYDSDGLTYDEYVNLLGESIDKVVDMYTHTNGKVYIDDWGDFEEDLNIEIVNNLEKTL